MTNKEKKKQFGEVFTPVRLVNEMLDTLPQEVWSNPNLKWLDPAAGSNMIFPIEIYKRLLLGLKDTIPNDQERKNHIWKKMLYMCEIQPDAVVVGIEAINKIKEIN